MEVGLNGYHTDAVLSEIKGLGFTLLRVGVHTGEDDRQVILHVRACGFQPLVIVRDAAQVLELGPACLSSVHVEYWNEPDGAVDRLIDPVAYAQHVPEFVAAAHQVGAFPWIGAISNLHRAGLDWLRRMEAARPPIAQPFGCTLHRYPHGRSWQTPHEGFRSRAHEIETFRSIVGEDRIWGCSEFGYHTAPQILNRWLPKRYFNWRWTDDQVKAQLVAEWRFWSAQGAAFAVLYQITDGPTDHREDRFGIRRLDGTWKPSADSVREAGL